MQKWEYHKISINKDWILDELNTLGDKGWELVSITSDRDNYVAFFKRPKS